MKVGGQRYLSEFRVRTEKLFYGTGKDVWRNYNIIIEQSKMNLKSEAFLKRR